MKPGKEPINRLNLILTGRVQGVGFRAFVEHTAHELGLTGWVRNRWDGSVEVTAEGDHSRLEQLLEAVRRGPRAANVTEVHFEWQEANAEFSGFTVRRTV